MDSVAGLLAEGRGRLASRSPEPALDTEVLLARAIGKDRTFLFTWPEYQPPEDQCQIFRDWLERRASGEPVAYLTGCREFFGHEFLVSPETLIPRPDTELLVEVVLQLVGQPDQPLRALDMGTGSGAIAISLALACPAWSVLATDSSLATLELAERNAQRLRADNVSFCQSDWYAQLQQKDFHVIVSNPPYIAEADRHLEQGDVRFEPRRALSAGPDGLADLRTIIGDAPGYLGPGGLLALEHGYDQAAAVRDLLKARGFVGIESHRDLAGHERVSCGFIQRAPGEDRAQ